MLESFLTKLLQRSLQHKCFPVNFAKFLRIPISSDCFWPYSPLRIKTPQHFELYLGPNIYYGIKKLHHRRLAGS